MKTVLGIPHDYQIDIWSMGCCIAEMYTGKVMFAGWSNNDMLRLMMEMKGPFPKKMRTQGAFSHQHFSPDGSLLWIERDSNSSSSSSSKSISLSVGIGGGKTMIETSRPARKISLSAPKRDVFSVLSKVQDAGQESEVRLLSDLLEKMFVLNPSKRITVEEAIKHPFLRGLKKHS